MKNIIESLNQYGFSRNESVIYTHLLSNQDTPAYAIAQKVNIPRTTVYKTLEALKNQGFVSAWIKNGVKHFSAENPEILKQNLKNKEQNINGALPEMLNLFNLRISDPSSKLYEGKEGVERVFDQILEMAKERKIKRLYGFTDRSITDQIPKYYRQWKERKNTLGLSSQLIVPHDTPMTEDYKSYDLRETRKMPDSFPFEGGVDIVGSFVAFFSFRNNQIYAITIDSPIIADMMTNFFTYIWETLDKSPIS